MAKRKGGNRAKARKSVKPTPSRSPWLWASLVLSLAGIGVSGYLAYKRVAGGSLACTRWAQCDVVNNSLYSVLFGIPISFIGLAGYLALLGAAVAALITSGRTRRLILALGLLMALGGFGFSLWLTYVEVYIIEALCAWCLASAAIITLLAITNGVAAWRTRVA
jgi:uncharacterized membrane protein